jgi:uncharacterized protein YneF (UPF0154 family)
LAFPALKFAFLVGFFGGFFIIQGDMYDDS